MSERHALQIGGLAPAQPWFREMLDTAAPGYAAAGLTLETAFPTRAELDVDVLLRDIAARRPELIVNRALTLAPSLVAALAALLPDVRFVTVCHSSQTFLMEETAGAVRQELFVALARALPNVYYATPHESTARVLREGANCPRCLWWPNWVDPVAGVEPRLAPEGRPWRVSLVSALRPLKALGVQIMAAAHAAERMDLELYLSFATGSADHAHQVEAWVNTFPRLRAYCVPWQGRAGYLEWLAQMDLGLQCSPTESENLVALDQMLRGIPVVGSPAVVYIPECQSARNPDCAESIAKRLQSLTVGCREQSSLALGAARKHTERTRAQFGRVLQELTA